MTRCVVVTGVAGFVGSNLAKRLIDRGYHVRGIDNLAAGTLENVDRRVDFLELDIRNPEIYPVFEGADAVFHLAAKTCLPECVDHPLDAASINVIGTLNVLEAARKGKVRKLIYADTSAEYEGVHEFPTPEKNIQPIGIYAASKHGGATFCESYRKLHGLNTTIVRYFNVYGPAQDWRRVIPPVMSSFIIRMLQGNPPVIYGSGEKRRDFIYIDDVNDFHVIALENHKTDGGTFNLGSGTNHSVNEIFQLIEGILKTSLRPIYKSELPGEAEITLADITAARNLGWKPQVTLREGLDKSIRYLQERLESMKIHFPRLDMS